MGRGCFITIEGVEGVGKTTNISLIESLLGEAGIPFITTREPGGTPLAEKIRALLLDRDETSMTDIAELLLVFAARNQHVEELIRPALAAGTWVISDRFTDSTFAYQGAGRALPSSVIEQVKQVALGDFNPDLTLLLDIDVAEGMARASRRGALDRFEQENLDFFEAVRARFLARASAEPDRFRVVSAAQPLPAVQAEITGLIQGWIKQW